jgi:Tol biopolymer transport system component
MSNRHFSFRRHIAVLIAGFLMLAVLAACAPGGRTNCGKRIAFISTRDQPGGDLFLINPDGSDLVKIDLESLDADLHQIIWSPNCESILITTDDGIGDMYVTGLDGTEPVYITNFEVRYGIMHHIYQLFGLESELTAYEDLTPEERDELNEELRFGNGFFAMFPDWSQDSQQITFSAGGVSADGAFMYSGIYLVNVDGSGFHPLFQDREVVVSGYAQDIGEVYPEEAVRTGIVFELVPRWMPDDETISFVSLFSGNLYQAAADGSVMERILAAESELGAYAFSPDGQRVAYEAGDQLYIADIENIEAAEAIEAWEWSLAWIVWSPTGEKLALFDGFDTLSVINVDGSGLVTIATDLPEDATYSWSPDGTQLVFTNGVDIFIVTADGSELQNLTEGSGESTSPIWSSGDLISRFDWW